MDQAELESRRERAIAQLDLVIDLYSFWRGRYEDDDRPAGIEWITEVIPRLTDDPYPSGWICTKGPFGPTETPGIGWRIKGGGFSVASLDRSLRGVVWPPTRKQFRAAARASGVSLPICHATLFLKECPKCRSIRCPKGNCHIWGKHG